MKEIDSPLQCSYEKVVGVYGACSKERRHCLRMGNIKVVPECLTLDTVLWNTCGPNSSKNTRTKRLKERVLSRIYYAQRSKYTIAQYKLAAKGAGVRVGQKCT